MKLSRIGITLMLMVVWLSNGLLLPTAHMAESAVNAPAADPWFGWSVAIDGDTAIVGEGATGADSAYLFGRNQVGADAWGTVKRLSPFGLTDLYNGSVAISGDIAVIGAPVHDAIHIFYRDQGGPNNWGRVKMIQLGGRFGSAVAINGDTIVVGAWETLINGERRGAAYVFQRNQGGTNQWGQVKQLVAADGAEWDEFGNSVANSGDIIVVGAHDAAIAGKAGQGAAYVFYRNQGGANNWGQVKKIVAADGASLDFFGERVSINADRIVVGAPLADVAGKVDQGAAYVFYRHQGGADTWGQVKKLLASDGATSDSFGEASIYQETIAIGASGVDIGGSANRGAAYVFYRNQGGTDNWGEVRKLTASDGTAGDNFSYGALQVNGNTLVVGAFGAEAAYVFYRDQGGTNDWGQVKKLFAVENAYQVAGRVTNNRHQPVFNATVSAQPPALNIAQSAGSGDYTLFFGSSGAYTLTASRTGFGTLPPRYDVSVNGNLSGIDFVLPPAADAVTNGGWETGDLNGWSVGTGLTHTVEMTAAHTGSYGLRLDSSASGGLDFEPSITQTVVISTSWSQPTLSWLYQVTQANPGDALLAAVSNGNTSITATVPITIGAWQHEWLDLSTFNGQTVTLQFGFQTQTAGQQFALDEISVGDSLTGVYLIYLPLVRRNS